MTFFSMHSNNVLAEIDGQELLFKDVELAKNHLNDCCEFIVFDKSFHSFLMLYACLHYSHPFMVIHPKWPEKYIRNYRQILTQYEPHHNVCFLPTSGSTGDPKVVCHAIDSLFKSAARALTHAPISPSDCMVLSLPPTGMGGVLTVVKSIVSGAKLMVDSDHWSNHIMEFRNMHFAMVPQQLQFLVGRPDILELSIAAMLVGGDGASDPLIQQCYDLGLPVIFSYGLTETCGQVVSTTLKKNQYHPLNNVSLDLYDGRLLIGCNTLAKGYISSEGFSKLPLINGMFLTNDLVKLKPDFTFVGRSDFQFQSGSQLINPQFIEAALVRSGLIHIALVIPQFDDRFGFVPVAYVPDGANIDELDLFSKAHLPNFLQPRQFLYLPDRASFEDPMCRQHLIRCHRP